MENATKSLPELENWEVLSTFLPPQWAQQARSSGAMRRARYISDPAIVLRILLLHLASGCSLAETAARAQAAGLAKISAVGVFKRLRAAEPWLRWLAQQMRGAAELPLEIVGRRVRAVDATAISEPGSTGTDWRIHYALNLADLECDFFALTDVHQGGESFRRVPIRAGDILLGDRVYASPPGVKHVVGAGGDVVVRLNRQSLPLYNRHGRRMELLPWLRRLPAADPREGVAWVRIWQRGADAGTPDCAAAECRGDALDPPAGAAASPTQPTGTLRRGPGIRRVLYALDQPPGEGKRLPRFCSSIVCAGRSSWSSNA